MKCKEHEMKGCSFYCKDCKEFICVKCITKAHKEHDVVDEEDHNTDRNKLLKTQKETAIELSKMSLSKVSPMTSGSTVVKDETEQQQKPELKVVQHIYTDYKPIYGLSSYSDGLVLLKTHCYGNLEYAEVTGDNIKVLSSFPVQVLDMTVDSINNIFLSVQSSTRLKVINVITGQISDSIYNVAPFWTSGIHITKDQKVILGVVTPGRQMVVVMDEKGNHIKLYELDSTNKAIFTGPCRITSTKNGNIGVVDVLDTSCRGKIVVLGQTGSIQIYNGHPNVNNQNTPFNPTGILTTPMDNIVVTDCNNHTLHILSCDGLFIAYFSTSLNVDIHLPYSLACSGPRYFYIGCSVGGYGSMSTKLFKVQYSGF
ncbi:uncharacterized protein [Mytilus edulis]|uniref:uncharacterized protein n=1 Tax=Mytilus edulis TaxID=6550 RepID=UPI0039EED6F6